MTAKMIIDCRVATASLTECNPYPKRLHRVKNVVYENDKQKLIIVKTLPVPEKKSPLRVISVENMIEKYYKIDEPKRFKGSDSLLTQEKFTPLVPKKNSIKENNRTVYGVYTVSKGDSLSKIAKSFGLKQAKIKNINGLKNTSLLSIGQKLKIPLAQKMVDAMSSGSYTVKKGDTLLSIALMFKLHVKEIAIFNKIKDATTVREGKKLKLPFPYILAKIKAKKRREEKKRENSKLDINAFGTHKLRVTATAYTSHSNQTDDTPFLAAWNNRLRPGVKSIAVSRDLLSRYGIKNGTKVRISGLRGYYRVRDKMNKRYRKRIDIYMGLNLRKALKWGRRSVVIYW